MSMADQPQTTTTILKPGQRWRPEYGGAAAMTYVIVRLAPADVVYSEGWPSDVEESFDQWPTWADWLLRTGVKLQDPR